MEKKAFWNVLGQIALWYGLPALTSFLSRRIALGKPGGKFLDPKGKYVQTAYKTKQGTKPKIKPLASRKRRFLANSGYWGGVAGLMAAPALMPSNEPQEGSSVDYNNSFQPNAQLLSAYQQRYPWRNDFDSWNNRYIQATSRGSLKPHIASSEANALQRAREHGLLNNWNDDQYQTALKILGPRS